MFERLLSHAHSSMTVVLAVETGVTSELKAPPCPQKIRGTAVRMEHLFSNWSPP